MYQYDPHQHCMGERRGGGGEGRGEEGGRERGRRGGGGEERERGGGGRERGVISGVCVWAGGCSPAVYHDWFVTSLLL